MNQSLNKTNNFIILFSGIYIFLQTQFLVPQEVHAHQLEQENVQCSEQRRALSAFHSPVCVDGMQESVEPSFSQAGLYQKDVAEPLQVTITLSLNHI